MKGRKANIVVKEFADMAKVFPHRDATIRTNLSNLLLSLTYWTNNLKKQYTYLFIYFRIENPIYLSTIETQERMRL